MYKVKDDKAKMEVGSWVDQYNLGHVVESKPEIMVMRGEATVAATLGALQEKKILSMPIMAKDGRIVGVTDVLDLATAVAFQPSLEFYDETVVANHPSTAEFIRDRLSPAVKKVFEHPIKDMVGLTEEGKHLWLYDTDTKMGKIVEVFSKGVHRVLVKRAVKAAKPAEDGAESSGVDDEDDVAEVDEEFPQANQVRFVSQSDVARFLLEESANMEGPTEVLEQTLKVAGLGVGNPIATMPAKCSALAGFKRMVHNNVSALPVVDESGKMVGTLSASDLRGMTPRSLHNSLMPVLEFLKYIRGDNADKRPVTCNRDATVGQVLRDVLRRKVHRAWVLDEQERPVGAVSLSDLLCKFSKYDYLKPRGVEAEHKTYLHKVLTHRVRSKPHPPTMTRAEEHAERIRRQSLEQAKA